jgi:hypothetical protein
MKKIRQQVKDGEIPHGGMVMTELLEKLEERRALEA